LWGCGLFWVFFFFSFFFFFYSVHKVFWFLVILKISFSFFTREVCVEVLLTYRQTSFVAPRRHSFLTSGSLLECFSKNLSQSDLPDAEMASLFDAFPGPLWLLR